MPPERDLDCFAIGPHDDPLAVALTADVASVEVAVFHEASDGVDVAVPLHDDTGEAFAVDRAWDDTFLLAFFQIKRGLCLGRERHCEHEGDGCQVVEKVHDLLQVEGR